MSAPIRWVVLDRDGVINHDSAEYIKSAAEWQPIPGSLEAIARLTQAGWRVCLATNQSGLGRGMYDYDAFAAMTAKMQRLLQERGGRIDAIAFAPEHPDQATDMRKPGAGMLKDLARRLGSPLNGVCFVGDSDTDLAAATAAGMVPMLVSTGNGSRHADAARSAGAAIFPDLATAVDAILTK